MSLLRSFVLMSVLLGLVLQVVLIAQKGIQRREAERAQRNARMQRLLPQRPGE